MTNDEREAFFQRYEAGPSLLRSALGRVPAAAWRWKPSPDKWSVHEIVVHCADSETNSAMRIRYLIGEPSPTIAGYDQDRWVRDLNYAGLSAELSLAQIESVRAWNAEFIRSLPESAWARTGRHTEHPEPYTAERWLQIYAEHLEIHARQIARTVDAWKAAGAPSSPAA
jgi:hypothetical protein